MLRRGVFISFEGLDGSGKTTQLRLLAQRLRAAGRTVLETAEPGGTPVGLEIRRLLLDPMHATLTARAELLLYCASRAQNVEQAIGPALAAGSVVLADRFSDSALAYQGVARGLGLEVARAVDLVATAGLEPDLTLLLDIEPETGLARLKDPNRMDSQDLGFYRQAAEAYRGIAAGNCGRIRVLDARVSIAELAGRIWEIVQPYVL